MVHIIKYLLNFIKFVVKTFFLDYTIMNVAGVSTTQYFALIDRNKLSRKRE